MVGHHDRVRRANGNLDAPKAISEKLVICAERADALTRRCTAWICLILLVYKAHSVSNDYFI